MKLTDVLDSSSFGAYSLNDDHITVETYYRSDYYNTFSLDNLKPLMGYGEKRLQ